jgi:hypothetical protein
VIPLLIGIVTLYWQSRTAFELKAAELVLSSYSPWAAQRRVELLQRMFGRHLPRGFAESFDPKKFPGVRFHEMKMELFRTLAEDPAKKQEVVQLWRQMFPEEEDWFGLLFPKGPASKE